jgi:poly-gamma-glutamate synthesis protein (capsule biosynthesis protein)
MLAGLRDRVQAADLAICHLETMLSYDNARLSGYPMFLVPHQLADAIADAGYDACSVASNHALDRGVDGMTSTLAHLDRVGVRHAGGARSVEEQATPAIYDAGGVRVGHLSYAYGFNGFEVPASAPWTVNRIDTPAILAEAARARAAGAEFVVLSLHWGAEYRHAPTPDQEALAAQLLPSPDIDLIIGHHAHVVQPVGRVGDEVVVYGMGNLLSNQRNSTRLGTQEGALVTLEVRERAPGAGFAVTAVTATPTYVEVPGFRVVPTSPTLHPDSYLRVLAELGPNALPS